MSGETITLTDLTIELDSVKFLDQVVNFPPVIGQPFDVIFTIQVCNHLSNYGVIDGVTGGGQQVASIMPLCVSSTLFAEITVRMLLFAYLAP